MSDESLERTVTKLVGQMGDLRVDQARFEMENKAMLDKLAVIELTLKELSKSQDEIVSYLNKGKGIMWSIGLAWSVLFLFLGATAKTIMNKIF